MASGFLEVQGFSAALSAMDAMCKSANVTVKAVDANNTPNPKEAIVPVVIQIKVSGSVGDVEQALEAGRRTALNTLPPKFVLTHSIAAEDRSLAGILKSGKLPPHRRSGKKYDALGCVDVQTFASALVVVNTVTSNADVDVADIKKYLGGTMVTLIFGGTVAAVHDAIEQAATCSLEGKVKNSSVITNPHPELYRFLG